LTCPQRVATFRADNVAPAGSHSPSSLAKVQLFVLIAPALLFAMIAHEIAHGYAALRQGDPTAYQLGRLTWNPVKHVDPIMTIMVPLVLWLTGGPILGGAKPVPVNPRNYRNYKRGDIIVSLAGVATNLALAVVSVPLLVLLGVVARNVPATVSVLALLQAMLVWGVLINLFLCAFNLLPLPPLDGSHVFKYLLPPEWSLRYQSIGRYGIIILIALLWLGGPVLDYWMAPAYALFNLLIGPVIGYIIPSHFLPFRV
jgi:Zn-dependent protease